MKIVVISQFLIFLIVIHSCNQIDPEEEKKEIQAQIDIVTKAHFEKDAVKFYSPNSESWVDVRNGGVQKVLKSEAIKSTQGYLDQMEFLELENSAEPIIEISSDGSMASYVGAIHLRGKYAGQPVFWVVSWQSVLKKMEGNWKIIQTANTELAERDMATVILQNVKKSLAGEEKINTINTIRSLANCEFEGDTFTTRMYSGVTHARFEQTTSRGTRILSTGPDSSFQYNPQSNTLKNELDTLTKQFIHGHELHWLTLFPETRFNNPVFKGYTKYDEKDAFEVAFTDDLNRPVVFYFDFENDLPLGFEMYTGSLEKGETVQVYYKSWEQQNDVWVFTEAEFKQGEYIFNYEFTSLEFNNLSVEDFTDKNKTN